MAINLLFASIESAGKTALATTVGLELKNRNKKVGYFIPFQRIEDKDTGGYIDATFSKEALHLEEPVEQIAPIHLAPLDLWKSLTEDTAQISEWLKNNYNKISKNKDIVIMEGLSGLSQDTISTLACYRIADTLDTRVIVILRYSPALNPSILIKIKEQLKQKLIGVIINYVPESCSLSVKQDITRTFKDFGLPVFGFITEVHRLLGITVGELVEELDARFITRPEDKNKLIENIMLGAMTPDSGKDYFNRMNNKAVLVSSERADMQLAALETSTSCLVLIGGHKPLPAVLERSEFRKIPIVVAEDKTQKVIEATEQALLRSTYNSQEKMRLFTGSIGKNIDFAAIFSAAGIQI